MKSPFLDIYLALGQIRMCPNNAAVDCCSGLVCLYSPIREGGRPASVNSICLSLEHALWAHLTWPLKANRRKQELMPNLHRTLHSPLRCHDKSIPVCVLRPNTISSASPCYLRLVGMYFKVFTHSKKERRAIECSIQLDTRTKIMIKLNLERNPRQAEISFCLFTSFRIGNLGRFPFADTVIVAFSYSVVSVQRGAVAAASAMFHLSCIARERQPSFFPNKTARGGCRLNPEC